MDPGEWREGTSQMLCPRTDCQLLTMPLQVKAGMPGPSQIRDCGRVTVGEAACLGMGVWRCKDSPRTLLKGSRMEAHQGRGSSRFWTAPSLAGPGCCVRGPEIKRVDPGHLHTHPWDPGRGGTKTLVHWKRRHTCPKLIYHVGKEAWRGAGKMASIPAEDRAGIRFCRH
jgi:hypothetical protein